MNRKIEFRGKNHQGRWCFGSLIVDGEFTTIKRKVLALGPDNYAGVPIKNDHYWESYHVDPETVGQFTGVTDGDGREIYEGDIVAIYQEEHCTFKGKVEYLCGGFVVYRKDKLITALSNKPWQVIGNIHDNPELLKGGAQ